MHETCHSTSLQEPCKDPVSACNPCALPACLPACPHIQVRVASTASVSKHLGKLGRHVCHGGSRAPARPPADGSPAPRPDDYEYEVEQRGKFISLRLRHIASGPGSWRRFVFHFNNYGIVSWQCGGVGWGGVGAATSELLPESQCLGAAGWEPLSDSCCLRPPT